MANNAWAIAVLCALIPAKGWAQAPSSQAVTIANTERRMLRSVVNGVEHQIDVAFPRGYATSQKRYPVVYTLDGNVFFPLLTASYRLAAYLIPDELIIVGIGYPAIEYGFWSKEYGASRARDYTPPSTTETLAGAGGAPTFLRFLREELIPFIDSSYRTVPSDRGLVGHSFGGLFGAYVLTHDPGLFQKYVIGSPSLLWDHEAGLRWESEYAAKHTELHARVYVYVGAFEDENIMKAPAKRFWEALRTRHYPGLDLVDFVTAPDEIHTSVTLGSMEHALRRLYARRSVSLSVEMLSRCIGEWKAGNAPPWAVRLDRDRLFIEIPSHSDGPLAGRAPERRELLAESETSFFSELGDISVVFKFEVDKRSPTEMNVTIPRHAYASVLRRLPATPGNAAAK